MKRYIDADKPIEIVREYKSNTARMIDNYIDVDDVTDMLEDMIDDFENIPTADVRENVRGEWIRNDNGTYSCSVCQSWIPEEQHCYARYCLHCGADMRGDKS